MALTCSVCNHPEIVAINKALADGSGSTRVIAGQYGLSKSAVIRHGADHLPKIVERAAQRKLAHTDDLFMDRLGYLWDAAAEGLEAAKSAARTVSDDDGNLRYVGRDLAPLAPLLSAAHRNLELLGQATGRLNQSQAPAGNTYISVILPRQLPGPAGEQPDQPAAIETTAEVVHDVPPATTGSE